MAEKTIQETQERIIREFRVVGDWTERYKYIIELGRKLEALEEKYKTEDHLVRGCQSQVWLVAEEDNGKVIFRADSDAAIVKGLAALMIRLYSDRTPDDIINTPPEFIKKIGMEQHLSATRSNGLASMVKQMKIYAMAYKSKMEQAGT